MVPGLNVKGKGDKVAFRSGRLLANSQQRNGTSPNSHGELNFANNLTAPGSRFFPRPLIFHLSNQE